VQVPHSTRPTLFKAEPQSRIRIVLVENHALMRECLRALIEADHDFDVVGEFESAEAGLNGIRDLQPDVVLTDLALPGRSGIDLLGAVNRISPMTRKLVLTAHGDLHYVSAAMGAGADGYVLKSTGRDELLRAIRTVSMGRRFLCNAVIAQMSPGFFSSYGTPSGPAATRAITEREREVLTCVAAGHSTKVIARNLGVSPKTVAKHRANLMRKLHLHSIAAITKFAIRNGLTGSSPYPSAVATQPYLAASLA
jgi:DNA-binding NarL/FixJ family response regulator